MKRCLLVALLGLASLPALAHGPSTDIDFYFAVDVPTDLPLTGTSTTVLPWNLARHRPPAPEYTLNLAPAQPLLLPLPTVIDACHLLTTGEWLLSVQTPMDDPGGSGVTFRPGDVIRYDPTTGTYAKFFDGVGFGLADGVNVDAAFIRDQTGLGSLVFQKDNGNLVLSFDVPTDISGLTYMPADLVEFQSTGPNPPDWAVVGRFFDSVAAGVPQAVNVTGADERGGFGTNGAYRTILTFDVPTDPTGVTMFLPGDLVGWDPSVPGFDVAPYHRDLNWPIPSGPPDGYSSRINALCFLASPGRIRDIPPGKLEIAKGPGAGQITLNWSASCSVGAEDYGIHEGTIGSWYSHDEIDCSDNGGDLTEVVNYAAGNMYYLVVPHNSNDEGSYGLRSVPPLPAPAERPPSSPYPNCEANVTNMRELSCP
jgi:hypothetical protein